MYVHMGITNVWDGTAAPPKKVFCMWTYIHKSNWYVLK